MSVVLSSAREWFFETLDGDLWWFDVERGDVRGVLVRVYASLVDLITLSCCVYSGL